MTINYQFPYYPYTQFPGQPGYNQLGGTPYSNQYQSSFRPFENSYIENILRLNLGKTATIYMNFENSQWGSKIFKGELVGAGRDHILLKDNQTNVTYLLLRIYLCYVSFDEDIEYEYPFA
ncbi:MAG TPA: spore coat protein GerQ [Acholeplasmatales bacterium]|jgi:spore coat protein gerQ|nr:spore coat protein GerQ [Bacilli bacterium]MBS6563037.1 spore coat protein GerQ [Staphylococcus sp.]CDC68830.1 spore coat protein GerQ [Staphylococcus sp. CAG:324]HAR57487.1 spore coat protein GerQ [Acholeplasmatales bacterium]